MVLTQKAWRLPFHQANWDTPCVRAYYHHDNAGSSKLVHGFLPRPCPQQGLEPVTGLLGQAGGHGQRTRHAGVGAADGKWGAPGAWRQPLMAHALVQFPCRGRRGVGGRVISSRDSCWAAGLGCPPRPGLSHCCQGWSWVPGTHSSSSQMTSTRRPKTCFALMFSWRWP